MGKMAVVISFDMPADDYVGEVVEDVVNVVRPLFAEQLNASFWVGIDESADEVLNVIGVD